MTSFKDSDQFSRTFHSVWWQSLKAAITSAELWEKKGYTFTSSKIWWFLWTFVLFLTSLFDNLIEHDSQRGGLPPLQCSLCWRELKRLLHEAEIDLTPLLHFKEAMVHFCFNSRYIYKCDSCGRSLRCLSVVISNASMTSIWGLTNHNSKYGKHFYVDAWVPFH